MTLLLHCGARVADIDKIASVPTPAATKTWQPVAHLTVLNAIETAMSDAGFDIVARGASLNKSDRQMFGMSTFWPRDEAQNPLGDTGLGGQYDNSVAVGYRNSLDKSCSIGFVSGARVLVCDNMAFSGSIKRVRKHTTHVFRDLDRLAQEVAQEATAKYRNMQQDFADMVEAEIDDKWAFRLIGEALGKGLLTTPAATMAIQQWKKPRHEEWAERHDCWRLYAGMTEGLKGSHPRTAMQQYTGTHELVMQHVRVSLGAAA